MKKLTRWERMLPASPQMAYWQAKDSIPSKWQLLRKLGKEILSANAQQKLGWIIFYNTIGDSKTTATSAYFDITSNTLHKYLSRFDDKNLRSLEEHSRRPEKIRWWMIGSTEEARIIDLRKRNMEYGNKKLKVLYIIG